MKNHHLTKQFPKPGKGEYVPITFIEFKRKQVGWSPELKRSVYPAGEEDKVKLKRVREVNVLVAINHLSGNVSSIELTDEEKKQFEEVYRLFLEKGGQLVYTRKKIGAKTVACFEVRNAERKVSDTMAKTFLSERL